MGFQREKECLNLKWKVQNRAYDICFDKVTRHMKIWELGSVSGSESVTKTTSHCGQTDDDVFDSRECGLNCISILVTMLSE
jgi:hypothetical protein